ncbi:hypothetical protein [Pseudomonas protegens]|uniref:hypothetical protein n=1 Tax=Pseudomonas protegens TaxID=380021 RepID=UPI002763B300|nr:hypothetical protein [Pseudomonas protegens]MDP9514672.1 hypothetical protein [Pseudomonas protegens]
MEPQKIGGHFKALNNGAFFTPEENTTGMIVRTATMHTGAKMGILSTGIKKPLGIDDNSVPAILTCRGANLNTSSGAPGSSATLPFPVVVPAGQGLWAATSSTYSEFGVVYVTWDPLPAGVAV